MPDPDVLKMERSAEDAAKDQDYWAREHEKNGLGDPLPDYKGAAEKWRKIAEDYRQKAENATKEDDELDYICRQAAAWAKAAADYAKASQLSKKKLEIDDFKKKSDDAYEKAAKLYEQCANRCVERGDLVRARPHLEWADTCYQHVHKDDDSKRVRKAIRKIRRWLEKILDGQDLGEDEDNEDEDD